jgi:hypothetical protein
MIEVFALLLVAIGALTLLIPAWAFGRWDSNPRDDDPEEWRQA